ncbi:MAG: Gfo/Idh/MocA family protein [Enterocloster clostridioformis]
MVTYTYMGHVTAKYARELVASGAIGEVRTVMAEYPQGWLAFEDDFGGKQESRRCDPQQSGGVNCLGDLGTHVENAVAAMTGLKIKRLLAKMDVIVPGRVLDDNDSILVEYDNGATGIYWTSQVAVGHDNSLRIRIYGSRAPSSGSRKHLGITVIDADGTIREIHRGYGAIGEKGRQIWKASGRTIPKDGLRPWVISTAVLQNASAPSRREPSIREWRIILR